MKEEQELAWAIRDAARTLNAAIINARAKNVLCKVHVIDAGTIEHGTTEIVNVEVSKRLA